jgi:DNA-binding CsgD family transcriptional regulator
MTNPLDVARDAVHEHRWRDALDAFASIDVGVLAPDDLERFATAAYLVGDDERSGDVWPRAHQAFLEQGDPASAARCAFRHACGLFFRGDMAPAMGWIARGKRVLDESGVDTVERGWPLTLENLPVMFSGDAAAALPRFEEAFEIGRRFNDPTAMSLSRVALGQAYILTGRVGEGLALLDEAMVSVSSGEVSPLMAGIAYCAVITTCQELFDLRRAREWTTALTRWCDAQQGLVPFRGNCLVHRCEIFQLQGQWQNADEEAQRACDWLAGPPPWDSLGAAAYQLGEVRRVRGDFAGAEEAYRTASRAGREPEPGMSLLRLAQGRADAAASAIRRVLDETQDPAARARILPAAVEIHLAVDDVAEARAAADELGRTAEMFDAPLLRALAGHALGAVLLAEGDHRGALTTLRAASGVWRELDAPYETARARELLADACRAAGDEATADLELDAARACYEDLGAAPDVARLTGGKPSAGGLTTREVEVLRLVASGKTNRQVATELVLSEKTVARHVANIFTKLGVSSRTAATAYAYEHGIVST